MERIIDVTIRGLPPGLLMSKCPDEEERTAAYRKKENEMSAEELCEDRFEKRQYRTAEGKLYLPACHLKGALMEAASSPVRKMGRRRNYKQIVGTEVMIEPPKIIHKITELTLHKAFGNFCGGRERRPICRPLLEKWEVDFQLIFYSKKISAEILKILLQRAGVMVGTGDWRPQVRGRFGRFEIIRFELRK